MDKKIEKRCKNCKYFKRHREDLRSFRSKEYGECICDKFEYGASFYLEEGKIDTDKLFYSDYEDYSASFEVGENFGCIHFCKGGNKK